MQSGGEVRDLSIATLENWRDKASGERREKTEWHRVVIFNENLIEVAERFLKKGSKVYIEGQIETRKWSDESGQEKYSTEIVLRPFRGELTMLDAVRAAAPLPARRLWRRRLRPGPRQRRAQPRRALAGAFSGRISTTNFRFDGLFGHASQRKSVTVRPLPPPGHLISILSLVPGGGAG